MAWLSRVRANTLLDRNEEPRAAPDYSYRQPVEIIARVPRGLADVTTGRQRVPPQADQVQASANRLHNNQITQTVRPNREDLARAALAPGATALAQIDQGVELAVQEFKLSDELESVAAMLSAKHPAVARAQIDALVHEAHQQLAANATVTTHLIPLTLNRCRKRLAATDAGPDRGLPRAVGTSAPQS